MAGQVSGEKERLIEGFAAKYPMWRLSEFTRARLREAYDSGERAGYQRALEDAAKASCYYCQRPDEWKSAVKEGTYWVHHSLEVNAEVDCGVAAIHELRSLAKGKEGSNGQS